MKKIILMLSLFFCITNIYSQSSFDPVVAQVKLTKTHLIKLNDLEEKIALTEKQFGQKLTNEQKDQLLDSMINNELVMQAAIKDGVIITETQIISVLKQQAGPNATDQQIKDAISAQYRMSWEEVLEGLKNQFTLQEYIKKVGAEDLKNLAKQTTEEDVVNFYNANKTKFINPDMVRVKHIYFRTFEKSEEEVKEAKKSADKAIADLKSGKKTFDELVNEVSEDQKSKSVGGELGFLTRDNPAHIKLLGSEFLNEVFNLPMEGYHGVIKSNSGYHIIAITEKRNARILSLNDPVDPSNPTAGTVAQFIAQKLQQETVAKAFNEVTEKVVEDVRKEAVIKVIDKSIPWK